MKTLKIFIFLILLNNVALTQSNHAMQNQIVVLDSLLLINSEIFNLQYQKIVTNPNDTKNSQRIKNYYQKYFSLSTASNSYRTEEQKKIYQYYVNNPQKFLRKDIGSKAYTAYIKLQENLERSDFLQCKHFFALINFYKYKHIDYEKTRLRLNLEKTKNYLNINQVDSAQILIHQYINEDKSNIVYKIIGDSLKKEYKLIMKKFNQLQEEKRYQLKSAYKPKIQFGFNPALNFCTNIKKPSWNVHINEEPRTFSLPLSKVVVFNRLANHPNYHYSLFLNTYFSSRLCWKISYSKGNFIYASPPTSPATCDQQGFNSKVKEKMDFYSLGSSINYFIMNKTGMRPFIGLGFGMINYSNIKYEMDKIYFDVFYISEEIDNRSSSYTMITQLGIDYIPGDRSHYFIGIHFDSNYLINKKNMSDLTFALSIAGGFVF